MTTVVSEQEYQESHPYQQEHQVHLHQEYKVDEEEMYQQELQHQQPCSQQFNLISTENSNSNGNSNGNTTTRITTTTIPTTRLPCLPLSPPSLPSTPSFFATHSSPSSSSTTATTTTASIPASTTTTSSSSSSSSFTPPCCHSATIRVSLLSQSSCTSTSTPILSPPLSSSPAPLSTYAIPTLTSNVLPFSSQRTPSPSPSPSAFTSPFLKVSFPPSVSAFLNEIDLDHLPDIQNTPLHWSLPDPSKHYIQIMKHRLYERLGKASKRLNVSAQYNEPDVMEMEKAAQTILSLLEPFAQNT